jgi:threonylcarbamoyladenosine tRNA methylthiotransferase MtaB
VGVAENLVAAGASELVLTGINLGRYRDGAAELPDLLRAVAHTGVKRIRLSSIEPLDLTDELLETLASLPSSCPHLHVPLQSGSDAVLRAMRRNYTVAKYVDRINVARSALPGLAVTTDVMAGFPGETEADACDTLHTCEQIGFAKLHVFRYSERTGTVAASMPQLSPKIRAARAASLRELGDRMRIEFVASRVGDQAEVLIERLLSPNLAEGTTPDYIRVRVPLPIGIGVGSIVKARLHSLDGEVVLGQLV